MHNIYFWETLKNEWKWLCKLQKRKSSQIERDKVIDFELIETFKLKNDISLKKKKI